MLPAYAGMIPKASWQKDAALGAPRVCGDDPSKESTYDIRQRCSPRMRG